jgi:hypothetical protein
MQMTVFTRALTDRWQLNYDTEARQLFVSSGGQERRMHEFLASDSEAQNELELLIMDMFPSNDVDVREARPRDRVVHRSDRHGKPT